MANEFIARNGITSLGNIVVSGSITTTGTVAISGSIASASFAATASSADNLLVRNTLTAQTLVVQTITSSVDFVTGSTKSGTIIDNTHQFTGSLYITGSVGINAASSFRFNGVADTSHAVGYDSTVDGAFLRGQNGVRFITGAGGGTERMRITGSGNVGIGTTSMSYAKFNVFNNTNDATYGAKIQAIFGNADYQDSDAIQNYGSGTSETQFLVGSTSRPAMLSLGGNINASEAVGVINFFRSANTDTYRSRAWVWAGINSTGTANQHGGYLAFSTANDGQTNPQERLRIESGGNVGIGTTTPARKLDVFSDGVQFGDGGSFNFYMNSGPGAATGVTWTMNGTDRFRITAGGDINVLGGGSISTNGGAFRLRNSGQTASYGLFLTKAAWFGGGSTDYTPSIAAETGYGINTYTNGSTSPAGPYVSPGGTTWTAGSSDVRKKKNFETTQGLEEILQIEPIKYHFNEDDDSSKKRLGFKAQNILSLIPEMVSETGELAEDGSPYLTVTPDYILPVLVKAIQELTARVQELENK